MDSYTSWSWIMDYYGEFKKKSMRIMDDGRLQLNKSYSNIQACGVKKVYFKLNSDYCFLAELKNALWFKNINKKSHPVTLKVISGFIS